MIAEHCRIVDDFVVFMTYFDCAIVWFFEKEMWDVVAEFAYERVAKICD